MKTTIRIWGHSLAVRIPKAFAVHLGINAGEEVDLSLEENGLKILPASESLERLLEKVTPQNLHKETDTGESVGNEAW